MNFLVFYAPSVNSHLGFEPSDSNLSGVKHSCVLGGCSVEFHRKGKKNREVDNSQSKLSRDTTSLQEEEDVGTSCSSLRAWTRVLQDERGDHTMPWTRMLQDEGGHHTMPWWQLVQGLAQPCQEEEPRTGSSTRTNESHRRARDSQLCQRSSRDNVEL